MAITLEDCKKVIDRFTKDGSMAVSFKIRPISDSPAGFLGDHYRLFITYKTPLNRLQTTNFFLKTVPQGNANHAEYVKSMGIFKKEAHIYKYLLNEFQKYHDYAIAPKCYLVNPGSFIIQEDLSGKGFEMVDEISHENIVQLMKTLARFHASSIIYEEQRCLPGKTYRLIDHFPEELKETTFSPVPNEARFKWGQTTAKAVSDAILGRYPNSQQIAEKFFKFATDDIFKYVFPSKTRRNMINHADLWKNNIMFHGRQCVIIDYQLVRYTPAALDVMTALHINCSNAFLKEHMKELQDIYYTTFKSSLEKYGIPIETVYKDNEFENSLKEFEIASLTEAAMFGTIIFISKELAQTLGNCEETFKEFNYTNRGKYVLEEIESNPQFREKFYDILDRLVPCLLEYEL